MVDDPKYDGEHEGDENRDDEGVPDVNRDREESSGSEQGPGNTEELLLDLHLGRIGEHDRDWLKQELDRDAALRRKSDQLGRILRPLDHWSLPPMPDELIDRVLAHVGFPSFVEARAAARLTDQVPQKARHRGISLGVPLREFLAVAACIALLIGALVPGLAQVRYRSQRTMCASNLGSIFQGAKLYQAAFAGALPFAGNPAGGAWLPAGADEQRFASNSRHLFLLAKLNYGPKPAHFICPAQRGGEAMPVDSLAVHDDFESARNNSYDSLNLTAAHPILRPRGPIAYLGDRNPLFVGGRFDPSVDPDCTNSPAHRGNGQTVLTLDGRTQWLTSPVYGPGSDNVWLAGDIRTYTGTEAPVRDDDAQLVPGYPQTDPQVRSMLRK